MRFQKITFQSAFYKHFNEKDMKLCRNVGDYFPCWIVD